MSTLRELRDIRIDKLNKLKELGINPYPAKSFKSVDNKQLHESFDSYEGKEVVVSGRAKSIRTHGKLAFIDLKDMSGKIQLYIKEQNLQNANHDNSEINFSELDLLDSGDFIEGKGVVTKTQRGEISIEVITI